MRDVGPCIIVVGFIAAIAAGGCTRRQTAPPTTTYSAAPSTAAAQPTALDPPPAPLTQIGDAATQIFEDARLSRWNNASLTARVLRESRSAFPTGGLAPDLIAQLRTHITGVERGVHARRRAATMDEANGLSRIVIELSAHYQARVPADVMLLDYYGRQIEIGLARSQPATLRRATADLRQTWNTVEPSILGKGDVDDARRFTDVVVQLEEARRPADYAKPVLAERAEAERIENIFVQ